MSFTFNLKNETLKELGFNPTTEEKKVTVARTSALCLVYPVQFNEVYQWKNSSALPKISITEYAVQKYKEYIQPQIENMCIGQQITTYGSYFYSDPIYYRNITLLSPFGFFIISSNILESAEIPKDKIIQFSGRITSLSDRYFPNIPSLYSFKLAQFSWKLIPL